MSDFNVAIIGAGIAGASLAAEISAFKSVLLIEAEAQPGYHSTGRSAAFWDESYGGPSVQPLTTASGPFLANPAPDFHDVPLMHARGALHLGTHLHQSLADALLSDFADSGVRFERLGRTGIERHVPGLLPDWISGLWEPDCCDINVGGLHGAYLRQAKRQAVELQCNARIQSVQWKAGCWHLSAPGKNWTADILVNAAGAWADDVALMAQIRPLGIQPYRRTIAQLSVSPAAPANLPLVIGLDGSFYFKPDSGGTLWLSPHDETPTAACDTAPEEIDVALAIDRLQQVVDWDIRRVEHKWAGLRSFAPDRKPVIGPDPQNAAFFWLAGQGGFGIQTAPATAKLAASMIVDTLVPPAGVRASDYLPERLH